MRDPHERGGFWAIGTSFNTEYDTRQHGVHDQPESGAVDTRLRFSMSAFQEHALNSPDVCNNCFALVRRERAQTTTSDPRSHSTAEKSKYTRVEQTTDVDHAPGGSPTNSVAVFCECGVESAFERTWGGDDRCPTLARFKDLLKNVIHSLEAKGVTMKREPTIKLAIQHYRDVNDVNLALESGIQVGIQSAVAASDGKTAALAR